MAQFGVFTWLFLGALMSLTVCRAADNMNPVIPVASAASSSGMIPFDFGSWLGVMARRIRVLKKIMDPTKRSCHGFPCVYTHVASKAGRLEMVRSLLETIHSCAHDPACSPGKRRKRSLNSLLDVLKQRRNAS